MRPAVGLRDLARAASGSKPKLGDLDLRVLSEVQLEAHLRGVVTSYHTGPKVIRSYNAPKLRFSATLGREPEVEVGLA